MILVNHSIVVASDIGVAEFAQNVDLRDEELFFALTHRPIVNLFPDEELVVGRSPHLGYFTETALSNLFDNFVLGGR